MMARSEKVAWYNVIIFIGTIALFIPLYLKFGYPAVGTFGLCGLWGFGPWFFFPRGQGKSLLDERDVDIQRRSAFQGFGAFWGVFVLVVMLLWYFKRGETIPVDRLPLGVIGGMMIHVMVSSVVTIIMYRRGVPSGKQE